MNKIIVFLIFSFYITPSFGEIPSTNKNIDCGFNQCTPRDFTPILYLEQPSQTILEVGDNNNKKVSVNLPVSQDPRKLILSVNNNTVTGQDIDILLNSKQPEKNTEDFVLIGDIFKNIQINLNGYNGQTGKDASIICADRFKNGTYGLSSRDFFLNRRNSNPNLSINNCDNIDLQHIQNTKFQCDDDDFVLSSFDTVEVSRIKTKQKCIGTSIKYKCLQRQMKLSCEWRSIARGYSQCGKYGCSPCANIFGNLQCYYSAGSSCWYSDYNKDKYQISSSPTAEEVPPWTIESQLNRCSPRAEPSSFGGWFALQRTNNLIEQIYLNALAANDLNRLCTTFPSPRVKTTDPAWKFNRVLGIQLTTPGLDPDTREPLPGSNWIVRDSEFFTPCSSLGLYDTMNSVIESWTAYGEVGNSCNDARIPEDTNNLIPWSKAGEEQDTSFGLEKLNCSMSNCPVQKIVVDKEKNFDIIDPTVGANGTAQGNGILFIYDYQNLSATAIPGIAGNGGNNDLPAVEENKYCVKVSDALTQGTASPFAKKPSVSFDFYKWQGLKVNRGQASGSNPEFSLKKIKVYKKMDSSVRYLLQKELL
jgi:hypothetical protein